MSHNSDDERVAVQVTNFQSLVRAFDSLLTVAGSLKRDISEISQIVTPAIHKVMLAVQELQGRSSDESQATLQLYDGLQQVSKIATDVGCLVDKGGSEFQLAMAELLRHRRHHPGVSANHKKTLLRTLRTVRRARRSFEQAVVGVINIERHMRSLGDHLADFDSTMECAKHNLREMLVMQVVALDSEIYSLIYGNTGESSDLEAFEDSDTEGDSSDDDCGPVSSCSSSGVKRRRN